MYFVMKSRVKLYVSERSCCRFFSEYWGWMGKVRVFFGGSGCVIEDVSVKRFPSYADLT